MKERIIQLMEHEHLKQAQFAEAIGIQRAAMSHIISGRNNASLDVLTKILTRYPEVSPDWLLFGQGAMFREAQPQMGTIFRAKLRFFPKIGRIRGLEWRKMRINP